METLLKLNHNEKRRISLVLQRNAIPSGFRNIGQFFFLQEVNGSKQL